MVEPVALAGDHFEAFAIDDGDRAPTISDQPRALHLPDGFSDPGAPHAEHRREEFVGHRHGIAVQPIARHQEPASATLLDAVQPVAGGGLRGEVEESRDEAEKGGANRRALLEGRLALGHLHPQRGSGSLDDDVLGRLEGRSSLGRIGIIVHGTAGLFDPGWSGKATLELSNLGRMPVALYPGMRICSFTFEQLSSRVAVPYHKKAGNKYSGQDRPLASKLASETGH